MTQAVAVKKEKTIKFKEQTFTTIDYTYTDIIGGKFNQLMADKQSQGREIVLKIDSHYNREFSEIIVSIDGQDSVLVQFGSKETFYKEQLKIAREFIKFYKLDLNVKWVLMNF